MNFPKLLGVYDHLIVHCSATPATLDIAADWIDRVHRRKGWSMNGYHVVITRSGEKQWSGTGHRTRPFGQVGAHVGGCGPEWNRRSVGVCLIGGVKEDGRTPEDNFTDEQYTALREVIADLQEACGIPDENVMGHRDLIKLTNAAPKACPCFSVREFMDNPTEQPNWMEQVYDWVRLSFDWDRKLRPAPQRGEKLVLRRSHIVKKGETVWSISRVTGVPVKDIIRLNNLDEAAAIRAGQKLVLLK